ncbi:MAG: tetratricopeptide repeat protein [Candidatus Fermentibacteria bacterium]
MSIEGIRDAKSRGLLDYTIEKALERINSGPGTSELAELYSICSDVMFQKRQYTDAVFYGEKCVETDPGCSSGYSNLGWAEYWLGRNAEAVAHLEKASELTPDIAEIHYRLGSVYNNAFGKRDKALKEFTRTVEINPQHTLAWQQRGICFYQQKKYAEAESDYRKAAELGDSYSAYCLHNNGSLIQTPGEKVALGRDFWSQNNTQAAVDYFKDAIQQGFDTTERTAAVKLELADKLSWLKLNDEAEFYYTQAIEEAPENAEAHSRRGWHYYCTSKDSEAEADFRKAISLDDHNVLYKSRLGELLAVSGKPEAGIEILDRAIDSDPLSADLYQARAFCHKELGNISAAKDDFRQADFLGNYNALDNRRRAYGDEDAIDFFSAGVDMGQQNNPAGAVEQFRKAAEMFRGESKFRGDKAWRYTSKSLHNMGMNMHTLGGNLSGAADAVKEALDMDPLYIDAWVTLGNIHNSGNNNSEAMKCYTRAIELQPNEGRGFYSRGRIYMAEEQFDKGVADFTAAANLYQRQDWKADAYYNRARCHEGAGRIHEAIADYNEAFNNGISQGIVESGRLKALYNIE